MDKDTNKVTFAVKGYFKSIKYLFEKKLFVHALLPGLLNTLIIALLLVAAILLVKFNIAPWIDKKIESLISNRFAAFDNAKRSPKRRNSILLKASMASSQTSFSNPNLEL